MGNHSRHFSEGTSHGSKDVNTQSRPACQRQCRSSSNWDIDYKILKKKLLVVVFFFFSKSFRLLCGRKEEKAGSLNQSSALAQKSHGSAGEGLLVSTHPSSILLERKLGLNPPSCPHTLLVQSLNSAISAALGGSEAWEVFNFLPVDHSRIANF